MVDSDESLVEGDLQNFKGIYYQSDTQKYVCPKTGAHFNHKQLCTLLQPIAKDSAKQKVALKLLLQSESRHLQNSKGEGEITQDRSCSPLSENFADDCVDEHPILFLQQAFRAPEQRLLLKNQSQASLLHTRKALPIEKAPNFNRSNSGYRQPYPEISLKNKFIQAQKPKKVIQRVNSTASNLQLRSSALLATVSPPQKQVARKSILFNCQTTQHKNNLTKQFSTVVKQLQKSRSDGRMVNLSTFADVERSFARLNLFGIHEEQEPTHTKDPIKFKPKQCTAIVKPTVPQSRNQKQPYASLTQLQRSSTSMHDKSLLSFKTKPLITSRVLKR